MGRNKWKGRKVGRRSKRMEGRKIERKEAEGGKKQRKEVNEVKEEREGGTKEAK